MKNTGKTNANKANQEETNQNKKKEGQVNVSERSKNARRAAVIFFATLLFGLIAIVFYSFSIDAQNPWSITGISLLVSGATALIGVFLGFIFGIPKTLQHDTKDEKDIDYHVNTNLEQISDWLTKILVGVGLTQLNQLSTELNNLGNSLAPSLGNISSSHTYGIGIVLYFLVTGFLAGYLTTRIVITKLFRSADADQDAIVKRAVDQIQNQQQLDAVALDLANRQLSDSANVGEVGYDELRDAIKKASSIAQLTISNQASKLRSDNWKKNKKLMEKAIPVFKALIESSPGKSEYYGQLGFALKDKENPDWKEAATNLSSAIKLREDRYSWLFYEFNRAKCNIMLDENLANDKPAQDELKKSIAEDLHAAIVAYGIKEIIKEDAEMSKWIKLNKVELTTTR